jgi:hypothetical protein
MDGGVIEPAPIVHSVYPLLPCAPFAYVTPTDTPSRYLRRFARSRQVVEQITRRCWCASGALGLSVSVFATRWTKRSLRSTDLATEPIVSHGATLDKTVRRPHGATRRNARVRTIHMHTEQRQRQLPGNFLYRGSWTNWPQRGSHCIF